MNYTLNQLQIFLKIVQTNSVTRASKELNLTQPAVSIQLKNFQDQFDIPLTEVVGRKLYVTDFGKEIAEAAENIINQVYAINYKTHAFKGQLFGRLRISVVSTGKYIMPYFLADFLNNNPGVELIMDVTNKTSVVESIELNEVDFALVSIHPQIQTIERMDLLKNKLYMVGNSEKMTKSDTYNLDDFSDIPLIFREKGSGTRQVMESFVEQNFLPTRKKIELTSNEAVKQAVLAGLGCSIMPLIGIKNELSNDDLKIINMKGLPIETTWSLIWQKSKKHAPVSIAFLEYLKEHKAEIVKKHFNWYELY
jgi:DNA-binding transcriptional LysR family regulator